MITYQRMPDEQREFGDGALIGYLVLDDGIQVGTVFQQQYRWSRMTSNGRIRLRDYHPVEWAYSTATEFIGHRHAPRHNRARTRTLATEFLLRDIKEGRAENA